MGATTPKYIYNLDLVQWLLLIPASILAVARWKSAKGKVALFFVLATLIFVFLITPLSTFLWDFIPPAALVQFPWRFLGPAAFTLAMSVGILFSEQPASQIDTARSAQSAPHTTQYIVRFALFRRSHYWRCSSRPCTMYPPLGCKLAILRRVHDRFRVERRGVGTTSTGDFCPN
jgi:hypothetical protein